MGFAGSATHWVLQRIGKDWPEFETFSAERPTLDIQTVAGQRLAANDVAQVEGKVF